MKYLADLLTFARFVLGIVLVFSGVSAEVAFSVFLAAVLTDAFDGTCARKWPFPRGKEPKYRKYAAKYDMVSDALLAAAQVLFVMLRVDLAVGAAAAAYYVGVCGLVERIVSGKFFGHPDDCTKNSLMKKNFGLAKKIILARRYGYTLCLGILNAVILFATNWPNVVKGVLFAFGCSIFVFMWFFLRQRRKNISRDAVKIEQELARKKS